MATDRCLKWSKDAQEFFAAAPDNSLVLDIVASYSCRSQTGEGFEELVNSINSENIKRKIKKVNITDTCYLYRHTLPSLAKNDIPTVWYLNNEDSIKKLTVETELKWWADGVSTDEFKRCHKQIMLDYAGDENGEGIVQEFRDTVMSGAGVAAYKNKVDVKNCVDFILEECVYTYANLKNAILIYPVSAPPPIAYVNERYANVHQLTYEISRQAHISVNKIEYDPEQINKEIVCFMMDIVSNVSFFIIDKLGNFICRNKEFQKVTGIIPSAQELDPRAWAICLEVIKTGKQMMIEETGVNDALYLSVKAPLRINKKIEGVIGLAIDVTDRKKAAELKSLNAKQQVEIDCQNKIKTIFERFVRKINPQLTELAGISEASKTISEGERAEIVAKTICINIIIKDLLTALKENSLKDFAGIIK